MSLQLAKPALTIQTMLMSGPGCKSSTEKSSTKCSWLIVLVLSPARLILIWMKSCHWQKRSDLRTWCSLLKSSARKVKMILRVKTFGAWYLPAYVYRSPGTTESRSSRYGKLTKSMSCFRMCIKWQSKITACPARLIAVPIKSLKTNMTKRKQESVTWLSSSKKWLIISKISCKSPKKSL